MTQTKAIYYDGKRAVGHSVTVERSGDEVRISGEGVAVTCPLSQIKRAPAVAGMPPALRLPGGASCQLPDQAALERVLPSGKEAPFWNVIGRWEHSVPLAILALILTGALLTVLVTTVIPAVVRHVAFAVNPAAETALGAQTLAQLDRLYTHPSRLSAQRRDELNSMMKKMAGVFADGRRYRLEFRSSTALGANAFALPGGTIVVTDDIVALAQSDDALAGVLAHEAGHVRRRHALRQLLQASGAGLVIAAVTGDITSITSLAATLPATLINAGYSRDFEYEADDAAVEYLHKVHISPKVYADILGKLETQRGAKEGKESSTRPGITMFEDHPTTKERIRRVLAAR